MNIEESKRKIREAYSARSVAGHRPVGGDDGYNSTDNLRRRYHEAFNDYCKAIARGDDDRCLMDRRAAAAHHGSNLALRLRRESPTEAADEIAAIGDMLHGELMTPARCRCGAWYPLDGVPCH